MRAILTIVAEDPIRVSTSSLALVVIGSVLTGHGQALVSAVWTLAMASLVFSAAFMLLAIAAAMAGALDAPAAAPVSKEGDHG